MPRDTRQFSDAEINRLVKFYEQAEREILDRLNRALLRGNKTEYLAQMKKNIDAILQQMRDGNRTWCTEAIPRVYSQGLYNADAMLKDAGASIKAGFGAIHQEAAQVLAENVFQRFEDVTQVIGRQVNDIYRELALENVRGTVVGYDTWKQTARRFREQLAERGVTGFKDRSGRMWNMRTYAEMVARTSTMECHLEGTKNRLLEHGHDLVVVSSHYKPCGKCIPWEGKVLSLTGKTTGYPTLDDAKRKGLFHPNCFPAGVLVNGPAPLAAFSRWYEGEIAVITTASGVELSVTPNHPILTPKGWVAAGLLNEGDDIFRHTGQKGVVRDVDPDYQDIPAPIEQVVDSFGQSSCMWSRSMPVAAKDFHGDGVGSNVYVVRANGLLLDDRDTLFHKPGSKNTFCLADMRAGLLFTLGTIAQLLKRSFVFPPCYIGGINQSTPFPNSHSFKTGFHGIRTGFGCSDTEVCKATLDGSLVHPKAFCDSLFSLTSKISTQDVFAVQGDATIFSRFSKVANRNAIFLKDGFNGLLADTEGGRKLIKRLSGSITTDEIVSIKRNAFSGHVYNLQTKDGWYVANSIITHNCRHTYGLYKELDKEIEELEKELGEGSGDGVSTVEQKGMPTIPVTGISATAKPGITQAMSDALAHGLKTNTECLLTIDAKTGKAVYNKVAGSADAVQFPQQLIDFLDNASVRSTLLLHNHPNSSSFSDADVGVLARYDSVNGLFISGHDGTKYYIGKLPNTRKINQSLLAAEYQKFLNNDFNHFKDLVVTGKMTSEQAWKEHSHRIMDDIAQSFGLEYRRWDVP